jgi:hypothetical protein
MSLRVKKLSNKKIGAVNESVIEVYKEKGDLTMNDVTNLKRKILNDNKKKHKYAEIKLIKVLAGQWMTFTSEQKYNEYFENKVKDPSKFYEFSKVDFYVDVEDD